MDQAKLLAYANQLALDLTQGLRWEESDYGGYWTAVDGRSGLPIVVAKATAALEFFRRYAGPKSEWTQRAATIYAEKGDNQSTESGARAIGDLLRAWAARRGRDHRGVWVGGPR